MIQSEARTTAKTGVEMEALTAAAIAALTVIDMGKAIDKGMVVEAPPHHRETRRPKRNLHRPEEGQSLMTAHLVKPIRAAVLTVSDRCSRNEAQDTSGPSLLRDPQGQTRRRDRPHGDRSR